jgi:hypothetical protein
MLTTNERGDIMRGFHWAMQKCPVCGKEFLPAGLHSYKIGTAASQQKLVCTYTCQCKWEREQEEKKKKRRKGKLVRIVETGETFKSVIECAKYLNAPPENLYKCINRGLTYNGYHIERVR